jgi:alanine racemase
LDPPQAWRDVSLTAIQHNVGRLKAACGSAELMAVVKADAYSHGAVAVARAALEAGATRLGVAVLEEAFELRAAGITAPVLAWLATPDAPYGAAVRADIELAAYSCLQLAAIADAARDVGRPAQVHLKAETGMWRGGAATEEWRELVVRARRLEAEGAISVVGVWSHLACADTPEHPLNDRQRAEFLRAVQVAEAAGLRPRWRHLANSAATLTRPDLHFDLVRCGLAVYGVNPWAGAEPQTELRPAMAIRARVAHVKDAPADAGVSYGHTYHTAQPTRLALVPLGYADGIPSLTGPVKPVGHTGRALQIAGRVCMDQFVIDVADAPVAPGDIVTVLGDGRQGEYTAAQWSEKSGRSVYEVLTGMGRRRVPTQHEQQDEGGRAAANRPRPNGQWRRGPLAVKGAQGPR